MFHEGGGTEEQCCISRCVPGFAARVGVWRVGRGRRVPERTTNPWAVTPARRGRPALVRQSGSPRKNAAKSSKLQLQHGHGDNVPSSCTGDMEGRR